MKKIFVTLSIILTLAVSSAFADPTLPGPGMEEKFKREFAGAEHVTWTTQGDYYKATFVLGGHRAIAYFDLQEELVGCIRNIFFDQLPLAAMKAVDKRFAGADVIDVVEITSNEGTDYKISLELKDKKYTMRVSSDGAIYDVGKLKK